MPRCLELLDRGTLAAVRARGVSIDESAGALLLIEVDGDAASCEKKTLRIGETCTNERALDVRVAQERIAARALWTARREMSPARPRLSRQQDLGRHRRAAPLDSRPCSTGSTARRKKQAFGH